MGIRMGLCQVVENVGIVGEYKILKFDRMPSDVFTAKYISTGHPSAFFQSKISEREHRLPLLDG